MTTTPYSAEQAAELTEATLGMKRTQALRTFPILKHELAAIINAALSQQAAPGVDRLKALSGLILFEIRRYLQANHPAIDAWPMCCAVNAKIEESGMLDAADQPHPAGGARVERLPDHNDIAEFLMSIGWQPNGDAQWTQLRDALPTLDAMFPGNTQPHPTGDTQHTPLKPATGTDQAVYDAIAANYFGDTHQEAVPFAYHYEAEGFIDAFSRTRLPEMLLRGDPKETKLFTHPPEATALAQQVKDAAIAAAKQYDGSEYPELAIDIATDIAAIPIPNPRPALALPTGLHDRTKDLVSRFATALAEKLYCAEQKYGYSDGWAQADWMDECREKLIEHIAKGDPRDVAAYCAFLWHHDEPTVVFKDEPWNRSAGFSGSMPIDFKRKQLAERLRIAMTLYGGAGHAPIPEPRPDALVAMAYKSVEKTCDDLMHRPGEPSFNRRYDEGFNDALSEVKRRLLTPPDAQAALEELCMKVAQRTLSALAKNGEVYQQEKTDLRAIVRATLNQQKD